MPEIEVTQRVRAADKQKTGSKSHTVYINASRTLQAHVLHGCAHHTPHQEWRILPGGNSWQHDQQAFQGMTGRICINKSADTAVGHLQDCSMPLACHLGLPLLRQATPHCSCISHQACCKHHVATPPVTCRWDICSAHGTNPGPGHLLQHEQCGWGGGSLHRDAPVLHATRTPHPNIQHAGRQAGKH